MVGRPAELAAIEQELHSAQGGRISSVTLEGEPGIGKTRLLVAGMELARAAGFTPIAVTADEELRGPFLLARGIFASGPALEAAAGTQAQEPLQRALDAISGKQDPGLEGLAPDEKLLRTFDLAAIALCSLASVRPVALLMDDLQWADVDSLRMLRYVIRTHASSPIFLMLAMRPEETALVTEAVTLIADMERMGLVRRLRLARFTQAETTEFVQQILSGKVNLSSAAVVHAQAEGVPFIVEELTRTYRDAGMIQQIDGVWSLARNAERLVPSAVRTLIQRRAARLPDGTKTSLGEAAVLGRSFSLQDLRSVKLRLGDEECEADSLAEGLAPAVMAGLLVEQPERSAADYTFAHEQVRQFALAGLTAPRRRAIHAAIVEMLTADGGPEPASLAMLAHHAVAAGDGQRAAQFSIDAARAALEANAAEEALRLVDGALPAASAPRDRVDLLAIRDDALSILRRPADRLEGLVELTALAEALGDAHLELSVMLRRAAALRRSEEQDRAAEVARRVRELASQRGDRKAELEACLELGQDLLRTGLGEAFAPAASEVDLDGAEEALKRASELAEELGDEASLAAATRELGVIDVARVRAWFVEQVLAGQHVGFLQRVAAGETLEEILPQLPIAPIAFRALTALQRALELFERLGDRRGVMSSIIAMAYMSFGPDIHLGPTPAKRIEEIRRLSTNMSSFTKESERALADLQMLYGVQVFSSAKMIPDLALIRGKEAHQRARELGDRSIEFRSAGGVALSLLDIGDVEQAHTWLDRAAVIAAEAPTPVRARQLELWRGLARSGAGDSSGMREHLDRAVKLAMDQGRPAARCEALACLALEASKRGDQDRDEELLAAAELAAQEAKQLLQVLPGHPPWGAQADAALATVALARDDPGAAVAAARSALSAHRAAMREDADLEIVLPVARALLRGGSEEEKQQVRGHLQLMLAMIVQRTLDEDIRVRWFRGPLGRKLVELAGEVDGLSWGAPGRDGDGLPQQDARLLKLVAEGRTNREIAQELEVDEDAVVRRLAEMFTKIGASSRAEATAFAFREKVL